jgi:hypothetical protein
MLFLGRYPQGEIHESEETPNFQQNGLSGNPENAAGGAKQAHGKGEVFRLVY